MIDDAVATEAVGLTGKVYVDARGIRFDPKDSTGYGGYDESMREDVARFLEYSGRCPSMCSTTKSVPLRARLVAPECRFTVAGIRWETLADCCSSDAGRGRLVPGERRSDHAPRSGRQGSGARTLLERGAAATLGPVAEPYTLGFPKPAEFFGFLCTGEYTLVESYWKSQMLASWMTTLIGDPLYNPYKKNLRLKVYPGKAEVSGRRQVAV